MKVSDYGLVQSSRRADARRGRRRVDHFRKTCRSRFGSHVLASQNAPENSPTTNLGPFGEVIRATGSMARNNRFRFSTKYQDDETDLLYYGYRYYNASTGRWLNRDPIEEKGGVNLYAANANAFPNRLDYMGLSFLWDKPWTEERLNPRPDPTGDIFGATDWYYFRPHAKPYKPLVGCPCKYKINITGSSRVGSWWVKGDLEADNHERIHREQHYHPAHDAFSEDAEYHANICMSKAKADCVARVIEKEMRDAYMTQARAVAASWDCDVYQHEACERARRLTQQYISDLQALQQALDKCDELE
jgi:RHS repeat-associated protein